MMQENSSRPPFGEWLLQQGKRSGWIGDLSAAAARDRGFPRKGGIDEVRKRMVDIGADPDAFEALDDAELDWLAV